MKLLLATFLASAIALPVNAQTWQVENSENVKRVFGTGCQTEGLNKVIECHHVAITGLESEEDTLNFHFDSEDETSGISYIVTKQNPQAQNGESYSVVALFFRTPDGQISKVQPASGECLPNATISNQIAVVCRANLGEGISFNSVLFQNRSK
jgi:hypothetical protein